MTVMELDREYLWERCNILNAFLDEILNYEKAKEQLDRLDFKFEILTDLEMLFVQKPYDQEME